MLDIEQGRLVESCRGFPKPEKAIRGGGAPEALWELHGCAVVRERMFVL